MRAIGTDSSFVPGTKTVELLGFCLTVATARSNEAFLSFKSFVCCATRRSWVFRRVINVGMKRKTRLIRTLFDDGSESRLFCVAFCKAQSEKFLPRRFSHERRSGAKSDAVPIMDDSFA